MAKYIGMTIRKSIVVSFLPCLVVFWHSIPMCSLKCFFLLLVSVAFLGGGEKTMVVVVAQLQLAATYIWEMQGNTGKDCR